METQKRALTAKLVWFLTKNGYSLHFVPKADAAGKWWDQAAEEGGKEGMAYCGLVSRFYSVGLFSRMGAPRCTFCCKALDIPYGDGVPMNTLNAKSAPPSQSAPPAPTH